MSINEFHFTMKPSIFWLVRLLSVNIICLLTSLNWRCIYKHQNVYCTVGWTTPHWPVFAKITIGACSWITHGCRQTWFAAHRTSWRWRVVLTSVTLFRDCNVAAMLVRKLATKQNYGDYCNNSLYANLSLGNICIITVIDWKYCSKNISQKRVLCLHYFSFSVGILRCS